MKFDERYRVFRKREMIRVVAPNGAVTRIRVSATGETQRECKAEFERKRQEEISKAGAPAAAPVLGAKAFTTFAGEWLATYPAAAKNRDTTKLAKAWHVNVRLVPYFEALAAERAAASGRPGTDANPAPPITLGEINEKLIDKLIADLSSAPRLSSDRKPGADARAEAKPARVSGRTPRALAPRTVKAILQTLRRMLGTAKRWGELAAVPEVPSVKVDKAKFDFFTFEEADRLLAAIAGERAGGRREAAAWDDYALFITAIKVGPRAGELLGLTWDKVDLVKREIRIDEQLARASSGSKGGAAIAHGKLVPLKAGERTVAAAPSVVEALKRIRHLRGPWVFCDAEGNPYTREDLARKLEQWARRAGLRRMHPHGLRHTFCSHLTMRGVNLKKIQVWAGHSSIQTTMLYAHLAPGVGDDAINLLDAPAAQGGTK